MFFSSTKEERATIIKCFYGKVRKLIRHKVGAWDNIANIKIILGSSHFVMFYHCLNSCIVLIFVAVQVSGHKDCIEIKVSLNILMLSSQEASSILETIYSEYANTTQKSYLIQEFYGADFALFKVIIIIICNYLQNKRDCVAIWISQHPLVNTVALSAEPVQLPETQS